MFQFIQSYNFKCYCFKEATISNLQVLQRFQIRNGKDLIEHECTIPYYDGL